MSAQDEAKKILRCNKIAIQRILCANPRLILNKVHGKSLITDQEYTNLKSINKENVEGHVIELVDKIMWKGEKRCQAFLNLLQTDDDIKETYPELENLQLNVPSLLPLGVQASSSSDGNENISPESKGPKQDDLYQLKSQPVGLCVIINNEKFLVKKDDRLGTNRDAESLAEVFSWLGFRVLMCKDQTKEQMVQTLTCFASLSDSSQLQQLDVKEWSGGCFKDFQGAAKHGDAFICCILSHGNNGVVTGIDAKPLAVKVIRRTFKATDQSALTGKPKVFLIQACQGSEIHKGVLVKDLQADDDGQQLYIPEEADFLVAMATVEDYPAYRDEIDGTPFIQSVCKQLREYCPRGEDIASILHRVNHEVSLIEASPEPGEEKQMPEFRSTLRKKLVLSPSEAISP